MTTPKAILLSSLAAIAAFLYVSLQPSYSVTVIPEKGYVKANNSTGEVFLCEVDVEEGQPVGECRHVKERNTF